MSMEVVTRFAPSPTGNLHLGHAYSALIAEREARLNNGKFLLRIEDIDLERCSSAFEKSILEDLSWLKLKLPEPVRKQSNHMADYTKGLEKLHNLGLLYRCTLTRKELAESMYDPQQKYAPNKKHSSPSNNLLYKSKR